MSTGTIFTNNRTQAVRLPADMRFPASIKRVTIRAIGKERILSPADHSWDSFFLDKHTSVTEDFMKERAAQTQPERESL